ncbi:MAG TPA: tetratricopeptide repeat protein, partial [Steroidobacteraceae bacterium]
MPQAPEYQALTMRLADRDLRLRNALQLHQRGALEGAAAAYRALLAEVPDDADALNLLGVIEGQKANLDAALALVSRALHSNPRHALAHTNRARICLKLGKPAEALESARHALRLEPRLLEALHNEAAALEALGRAPEALESCERALALHPAGSDALMRRGYLLLELREVEAALESFERARRLRPRDGEPLRARGRTLSELNHFEAALQCYEQALRLNPADGDAYNGRGLVLLALGFAAAALESYEHARQLGVKDAGAYAGRAGALTYIGRLEEAVAGWEEALACAPDYRYGPGDLLYVKSQCCDWRDYEAQRSALEAGVQAGRLVSTPFAFLSACDTPAVQRQCALIHSAARFQQLRPPGPALPAARRERLTLGYLSADFRDHATARLLAGVIERHDRTAFAVTALSSGPDDGSAMLARLRRAFDRFVDVRERSDREAAELIRGLGIDILVDLNGFAAGGRPAILAQRPAPVQVSYLGYPGTLGAEFIDYLIADQYVIPEAVRSHYTEQIAYLPHCYQPNDCTR